MLQCEGATLSTVTILCQPHPPALINISGLLESLWILPGCVCLSRRGVTLSPLTTFSLQRLQVCWGRRWKTKCVPSPPPFSSVSSPLSSSACKSCHWLTALHFDGLWLHRLDVVSTSTGPVECWRCWGFIYTIDCCLLWTTAILLIRTGAANGGKLMTVMELSHFCDSSGLICYLYPASRLHGHWIRCGGAMTAVWFMQEGKCSS